MMNSLRTPEGDPLIDLVGMTEDEVIRLLFCRITRHNLNLLVFLSDSFQIALLPSPHRSKEWIVQELVKMAEYRKVPVTRLFQDIGSFLDIFSEDYLSQARRFVLEKWDLLSKELPSVLDSMNEETLREQIPIFLDLALHSKEDVTTFLEMAKHLGARLKMTWPQIVALHAEQNGDYEKQIRSLVDRRGGLLSFDEYYHTAMFEPLRGVYTGHTAKDLIGEHPDSFFVTSSENKVFQKLMARSLGPIWEKLGCPEVFEVVEMGAGNGTLAEGILEGVQKLAHQQPSFYGKLNQALRYHIVEISPALAEKQKQRLAPFQGKVIHHIQSAVYTPLPRVQAGLFLSNELVDMFSPTKLVHFEDELHEIYVSSFGGVLQECLGPLRPETREFLDRHSIELNPGETFFIQKDIEAWVQNVDRSLERGYVLTIDYGNRRPELRDVKNDYWMRSFYGLRKSGGLRKSIQWFGDIARRVEFPFNDELSTYLESSTGIGEPKDMTLFVDFTTLEESARRTHGLFPIDFLLQTDFLYQVGDWAKGQGEDLAHLLDPRDTRKEWVQERENLFHRYGRFRVSLMGKNVEPISPF